MMMNLRYIDLIMKMDLISKVVVLMLFILLSISCLIFFFKFMSLKSKFKQLNTTLNFIKNSMNLKDLSDKSELLQDNFAGSLIAKCLKEFKFLSTAFESQNATLSTQDWHILENSFCQLADQEIQKENYGLWILSTIAAISPLLGLFGTVWGLIDSFLVISDQASSDISAVGGGIAEALITTLGGVIVAISALVMYNYLVSLIESFEAKVVKLIEKCSLIVKVVMAKKHDKEFVKSSRVVNSINSVNPNDTIQDQI